jgi:antitoxin component YwqK of YwqJK toxin-antitoxin module
MNHVINLLYNAAGEIKTRASSIKAWGPEDYQDSGLSCLTVAPQELGKWNALGLDLEDIMVQDGQVVRKPGAPEMRDDFFGDGSPEIERKPLEGGGREERHFRKPGILQEVIRFGPDGKRDGTQEVYDKEGRLCHRKTCKAGLANGTATCFSYDAEGKAVERRVQRFNAGERNGLHEENHADGTPARRISYKAGIPSGEEHEFYPTGQIKVQRNYDAHGRLDGKEVFLDQFGVKRREQTWLKNQLHGYRLDYDGTGEMVDAHHFARGRARHIGADGWKKGAR